MKRRYRNYKNRTPKQIAAHKRNFSIFRLRGMLSSLNYIMYEGELKPDTNLYLFTARNDIKDALIAETGK